MSTAVFPSLPGLAWSIHKRPGFSTRVASHVSGREVRAADMAYPVWEFELSYEILRAGAEAELQTLMGFFLERQGQFDSFLFFDPAENPVTDQVLGEGDGTTTVFPFVRTLGGFAEPVAALDGPSNIYLNGMLAAANSYALQPGPLGVDSILVFGIAPSSGVTISADFSFYFNCRFADDVEDFENFMDKLWNLQSCKLRSVKI